MSELIKQFFVNPRTIGAMCPSTPFLAKEITKDIGLEDAAVVVEIGAGTGAFTRHILEKLDDDSNFLAIEINEKVYRTLKSRFPDIKIYNECASQLGDILGRENLEHVDTVVSGLPWAAFSEQLQTKLLTAIHENLKPGGTFTTFAYLQGMLLPSAQRFRRRLNEYFSKVEKGSVVWANIPPAFVYRCVK